MTYTLRENGTTITLSVPPDDALQTRVRDAVPGARWNPRDAIWEFPASRRVALALREFLRGHAGETDIDAASRKRLAELADSAPVTDIVLVDDHIHINVEFHTRYQDAFRALDTKPTDAGWQLPKTKAGLLMEAVERRGLDLIASDAVMLLAGQAKAPLLGYDQSLFSLQDIPASALDYVQNYPGKKLKTPFGKRLSSLGLNSLYDVITTAPLRYIDRSQPQRIKDLVEGEQAVVVGKIVSMPPYDAQRKLQKMIIEDAGKNRITLSFFRQFWLSKRHRVGDDVIAYGKYTVWTNSRGQKFPRLDSPRIDPVDSRQGSMPVIPVYPQSQKASVTTWDIMSMEKELLDRLSKMDDPLPPELRTKYALPSRLDAYRNLHFPRSTADQERAHNALAYEEMLELQLFIHQSKLDYQRAQGIEHLADAASSPLKDKYLSSLPYSPTGAQSKAIAAIEEDLRAAVPMHRLLQGDVGAGKTTVAIAMLLMVADSGFQGALMAPTEILAEQLYLGVKQEVEDKQLLAADGARLQVEFLGSKTKAKDRRDIIAGLADGSVHIVVGTHALLSKDVVFNNLGGVIIDEQHRFGTEQRSLLRQARPDGRVPDMLIMTATPIPRTAAIVMYGDMDLTILDELPPGRVPIETQWINAAGTALIGDYTAAPWAKIKEQIAQGRQAYVVASLVEDNEKLAAQSTEDAYEALRHGVLDGYRIGMVHGRMPRAEREETMAAFAAGDIDVLVSTTVIEVGVNVPNATVMVVLDAGRFGISQLHQIRGRVGRAQWPSVCYLVSDTETEEGIARLSALEESTDGFYLAEADLSIRGEGRLFGTQQSGANDLRFASLKDLVILEHAREDAQQLLAQDPSLSQYPGLQQEIDKLFSDKVIDS